MTVPTGTSSGDTATTNTTELVLPNLDGLTDGSGIMRVEMSPGGTTGIIGKFLLFKKIINKNFLFN